MWINKKGNKLTITFKYDQKVVEALRTISGRKFNKVLKRWEVPIDNIEEVCNTLLPLGFTAHVDVKAILQKHEEHCVRLREIKKNPGVYKGSLPLKDFQKIGASFIKALDGSLLADVPGLGKTIQTLAALEDEQGPHLILCPSSLKYSWSNEILKWRPTISQRVVDGNRAQREKLWKRKGFVNCQYIIANYELLLYDFDIIETIPWKSITCDEATRISNPQAKTTKALKKLKTEKRIALTGTPISNSPQDIFSIVDWIQPGYLGTQWHFQEKYCITINEDQWGNSTSYSTVVGYKNMDDLANKVETVMLRRTKEEVLTDFPPKTVETISFTLSEDEQVLYKSIKNYIIEELDKMGIDKTTLPIIPVKMLRLKQATNDPRLVVEEGVDPPKSTKLQVCKDLLKPIIKSGDKAIIFTQFAEMLNILATELSEYNPVCVYGDVNPRKRMEAVMKLKEDPKCKVILMTEAGAYGLNIQHATYVIHYDSPWSIAKLMQREDRSHRIGQGKPVTVYNLVAKNSIDEYVAKVLHKKQKTSVQLMKDFERLSETGMSEEDVNAILRL